MTLVYHFFCIGITGGVVWAGDGRKGLTWKYLSFSLRLWQDRLAPVVGLHSAQLFTYFDLLHHRRPVGPFTWRLFVLFQLGRHMTGDFALCQTVNKSITNQISTTSNSFSFTFLCRWRRWWWWRTHGWRWRWRRWRCRRSNRWISAGCTVLTRHPAPWRTRCCRTGRLLSCSSAGFARRTRQR